MEGLGSLLGFLTPIHTGMNAKHTPLVTDIQFCINNIVLGKRLHWRWAWSHPSSLFWDCCFFVFLSWCKAEICLASFLQNCSICLNKDVNKQRILLLKCISNEKKKNSYSWKQVYLLFLKPWKTVCSCHSFVMLHSQRHFLYYYLLQLQCDKMTLAH